MFGGNIGSNEGGTNCPPSEGAFSKKKVFCRCFRYFLFLKNPVAVASYYNKVNERVVGHDEDLEQLRELRILIDGAPMKDGILLQIFTKTVIGPVFFEIIQRKGNEGFGEGNFKALFESIEEDQIQRGVLSNA